MFFARVCLIVDNPLRDLDGLTLLAWQLAQKNVEVFLISMSDKDEVYFLKPDLVLVNYVRKANKLFIDNCAALGILVGVLDTEGGILKDVDEYFGAIFNYVDHVDLYCLWGNRQYKALRSRNIFSEESLKVTGCPRYDFCADPWRDALQEIPLTDKKIVLYNANFPAIHPRFQSMEKEREQLINAMGFDKESVYESFYQLKSAFDNIVEALKYLAIKFPEITFVIRPHPFEKKEVYEEAFAAFENVQVHQSGPVFPWIKNSLVVLHYNCSTAIEATMLGKEAIHMGWIKADLLTQPTAVEISRFAHSLGELEDMLRKIAKGQELEVSEQTTVARNKVIRDWFYADDGKSAERVRDATLEVISKAERKKNLSKYCRINQLFLKPLAKGEGKEVLKQVIPFVLGRSYYKKLKMMRYKVGKEFDVADVDAILKRITRILNSSVKVGIDYVEGNRQIKNAIRLILR